MELTCINWRFYSALSLFISLTFERISYYNKIQNQSDSVVGNRAGHPKYGGYWIGETSMHDK